MAPLQREANHMIARPEYLFSDPPSHGEPKTSRLLRLTPHGSLPFHSLPPEIHP